MTVKGTVAGIFIAAEAGQPMQAIDSVRAVAGHGLEGDRYCGGKGSFNKNRPGKRQVTLMNARFFAGSGFAPEESRRNIIVSGVELMALIGKEFYIGSVRLRGVKYCDPCERPTKLSGRKESFHEAFLDCGGLVAEVLTDGRIHVGDKVPPPKRGY